MAYPPSPRTTSLVDSTASMGSHAALHDGVDQDLIDIVAHLTGTVDPALAAVTVENTDVVTLPAGGTQAIPDVTADTVHAYTFGAGNVTFTFPAPGRGKSFTLALTQDSVGGRTVTWPSSATVRWAGGTAPTLTAAANKTDYLSFICTDGSHFDGFVSGLNY